MNSDKIPRINNAQSNPNGNMSGILNATEMGSVGTDGMKGVIDAAASSLSDGVAYGKLNVPILGNSDSINPSSAANAGLDAGLDAASSAKNAAKNAVSGALGDIAPPGLNLSSLAELTGAPPQTYTLITEQATKKEISDRIVDDINTSANKTDIIGMGLFQKLINGIDREEFKKQLGPMMAKELNNMYENNIEFQESLAKIWTFAFRSRTYPILQAGFKNMSAMQLTTVREPNQQNTVVASSSQTGGASNSHLFNVFVYYKRELLESLINKYENFQHVSIQTVTNDQQKLFSKIIRHYAITPLNDLPKELSKLIVGTQYYVDLNLAESIADDESLFGIFNGILHSFSENTKERTTNSQSNNDNTNEPANDAVDAQNAGQDKFSELVENVSSGGGISSHIHPTVYYHTRLSNLINVSDKLKYSADKHKMSSDPYSDAAIIPVNPETKADPKSSAKISGGARLENASGKFDNPILADIRDGLSGGSIDANAERSNNDIYDDSNLTTRPRYMPASYDWYYIENQVAINIKKYVNELVKESEDELKIAFKTNWKKYSFEYLNDYSPESVMRVHAQEEFNNLLFALCENINDATAEHILHYYAFGDGVDNFIEAFSSEVFIDENDPSIFESIMGYSRISKKLFSSNAFKLIPPTRNFEDVTKPVYNENSINRTDDNSLPSKLVEEEEDLNDDEESSSPEVTPNIGKNSKGGDADEQENSNEDEQDSSATTKPIPSFINFHFDNKQYKNASDILPQSYKWTPAILKTAYEALDEIFKDCLTDVELLSDIFKGYTSTTRAFMTDIVRDFRQNKGQIKKFIQNYIAIKHPHIKILLSECMEETCSLWLTKKPNKSDPKHLAMYTMFLLFFKLSSDDKKKSWIVTEVDTLGNKLPMHTTINKSIEIAIREFSNAYTGGQTGIITELRNISNDSTLQSQYNQFFVNILKVLQDPEPTNTGGKARNHITKIESRPASRKSSNNRTLRNRGVRK